MKYTLLTFLLVACGTEKGGNGAKPEAVTVAQENTSIKGDRGDAGAAGKDGSSCSAKDTDEGVDIVCSDGSKAILKDGEDGESVTGAIGPAGADAEPLPVNSWYDSLTKNYWTILPAQSWTASACGLYRFPSAVEMQQAINHGIFIASHAIGGVDNNAWTGDADPAGHVAILPGITGADLNSQLHGVFCLKD